MVAETLVLLNNNKILWGITMLLLNVGSKHIVADLGISQENLLKNEIIKKVIVFSMFFVATRDIIISFVLTALYIILIDGIFHENRRFSVIQSPQTSSKEQGVKGVNEEEYKRALRVIKDYEHLQNAASNNAHQVGSIGTFNYYNYLNNIQMLKNNI